MSRFISLSSTRRIFATVVVSVALPDGSRQVHGLHYSYYLATLFRGHERLAVFDNRAQKIAVLQLVVIGLRLGRRRNRFAGNSPHVVERRIGRGGHPGYEGRARVRLG